MNKSASAIGIVLILIIGGIIYYSYSLKGIVAKTIQTPGTTVNQEPVQSTEPVESKTGSTIKEFTIEGSNFAFTPAVIQVNKGDTVKMTFKNNDGTHDLVIDQFNIRTKLIKTGEQDTVQFVADTTGEFEFYCSVGSHRQMGMKGIVKVL